MSINRTTGDFAPYISSLSKPAIRSTQRLIIAWCISSSSTKSFHLDTAPCSRKSRDLRDDACSDRFLSCETSKIESRSSRCSWMILTSPKSLTSLSKECKERAVCKVIIVRSICHTKGYESVVYQATALRANPEIVKECISYVDLDITPQPLTCYEQ
jgi:hypothetical protein